MDEQQIKQRAAQLRKPEGEDGIKVAEWMNIGNVHININTLKLLNASAGDTILEIGMGNGFFVKDIVSKDPTIHYTGCDFSDVMIRESEKLNKEWIINGQAKFILADVNTMPFPDNAFSKIFTINTIYFWEDADKVLTEIKRVLKPGGVLIISLRPKHQAIKYPFTKYGFKLYSKEDVADLLSKHNFTSINTIEKKEPDLEVAGEMMKMESLLTSAVSI